MNILWGLDLPDDDIHTEVDTLEPSKDEYLDHQDEDLQELPELLIRVLAPFPPESEEYLYIMDLYNKERLRELKDGLLRLHDKRRQHLGGEVTKEKAEAATEILEREYRVLKEEHSRWKKGRICKELSKKHPYTTRVIQNKLMNRV